MSITKDRFNVGEKHLFLINLFSNKNGDETRYYGIFNESTITLLKTTIIELTCIERHVVPVEGSNDSYDGYVFSNENGDLFHNQYPSASFGQTSDLGNKIAWSTDGEFNQYLIVSSILEDLSRMKKETGEISGEALTVFNRINEAMTEKGYEATHVPVWPDHPDITRTIVSKTA